MYKYIVENVEHITASTLLLSLRKREGEGLFSFQAGQYAAISFANHHRPTPARCFSIVSSPTDRDILQFSMRVRGHFTRALSGIQIGDTVNVRGPYGGFVADFGLDTDVVMLAGGIGITPFISMARYAGAVQSTSKLTLIYSCANQDDIPFLEELKQLEVQNPNFRVIFVIGQGPMNKLAGQVAGTGRITPEILDYLFATRYAAATFFVCGPPPFMNGMVKTLHSKGVDMVQIVTEAFAQGSLRQSSSFRSWPRSVYVLGSAGFALGSLAVMASDLIKTLPPSTDLGSSNVSTRTTLTNSRQTDLDSLVNKLQPTANGSPSSGAVIAAQLAATPPTAIAAASASNPTARVAAATNTRTATNAVSNTAAAGTSVAKPPAATPIPAPPPKKCTTTQSGVTTCI